MSKQTHKSNISAAFAAMAAVFITVPAAAQQFATPTFTERSSGLYGVYEQKLSYIDKSGNATVAGKTAFEYLRGNGARAGYVLSHGGVIPNTVSVHVGAHSLKPNLDYYLDPQNGTLYFAEPVRRLDSISVSYRYVEGYDASRSSVGAPGLAMSFGGTSLNFGFGLSSGAGGLDFNSYGLALNSKLGKGGALSGLYYFSNPSENSSNRLADTKASLTPTAQKNLTEAKSDHLIAQNLTLSSGALSLRANYQDVGKYFNGFQAMKVANAKDAAVMAQIAGMEKEKGIQRLGFGGGLKLSKADNLSLDWDRIGDGGADIVRQGIGFQNKQFNAKWSQQTIGEKFTRFNDLREAEKAQWLKEKGVTRNDLTLGFNGSKGSTLNFAQNSIGDKSGQIAGTSLGFTSKNLNFAWMNRAADSKFARLNDLSDADKTALALDIHRQFDPSAAAATVTAKDKEQIGLEAGLKRNRMTLGGALTKQSAFAFNDFKIDDGQGSIERRTLSLTGKGYTVSYLDQNISDTYSRLGSMSDFEKAQFANERGIHRQSLGLNFALTKTSALNVSSLSIGDKDGGMSRQSLAYQAKGFDFKVNLADTSKMFARAKDLAGTADPEKAAIEAERGYKRVDLTANIAQIQAIKGLSASTYIYDAHNAGDNLDKSAYKHNLVYQANKNSKLTYLSEGNEFDKDGAAVNGVEHELITFDQLFGQKKTGNLKLNLYRDTLTTTTNGTKVPTITTDFFHFENDRTKPQNLMAETKRIDFGNGKFENTTQLDYNQRLNKLAAVHYNKLIIDRGKDPSSDQDLFSWDWQTTKAIKFTGSYATTSTNNQSDVVAKTFAVTGALNKTTAVTASYNEINQKGKNVQATSNIALNNTKPGRFGPIKNVAWAFTYAALNNQHKQQTENVGGKLTGNIGKHQVGFEYAGALAQNGTNAIARSVSFVSDRDAKLPIHMDVMYKARNVNRGQLQLVRKYNADCRMGKRTKINYAYASLPEDAAGNMAPTMTSNTTLTHELTKTMTLGVQYTESQQLAQKTDVSHVGGMIQGKLDKQTAVEVGYGVDVNDQAGKRTDGHTLKLGYDHQIDAEHFFTLSTTYTMYAGTTPDAVLANVEFKTRF